MGSPRDVAKGFAPATVANVAVGFDILGFAINNVGDEAIVTRRPGAEVTIGSITGVETDIPKDPMKNTATAGLVQLVKDLKLDFGFEVSLRKGIALGSGMGGSAASAVAALVAANKLLPRKLPKHELLKYALIGEAVASGGIHGDNVAPCLYGGLCLVRSVDPVDVVTLPSPPKLKCVLVHPALTINTREARGILKDTVPLKDHVRQSANLAGFLAACYTNDHPLLRRSLVDLIIEPQRAKLIPGFAAAQTAAMTLGALGFSISGSGPSVFALVDSARKALRICDAIVESFSKAGVKCDAWISSVNPRGAK